VSLRAFVHLHSIRLAGGREALIARVVAQDGRIGFGFDFDLDATAARHMAEWHAGVRKERPRYVPLLDHPWERAWQAQQPIAWSAEPAFTLIRWADPQRSQ
jgi:hypothetical protein